MSKFSLLHISDWHQHDKTFDRKIVRDALIKDISKSKNIELAIFSGDVAWSGKSDELFAARDELFDPLLKRLELKSERLFMVPGNHDLDRDEIELAPFELTRPLLDDAAVQKWLFEARRNERAMEPLRAFERFVSGYTGQVAPTYASVGTFELGGVSVAIVGLNSAWMCGRHKNQSGQIDDRNQIVVGEPQVIRAIELVTERAPEAEMRLVVLHHSFDWLAEFDRQRIEGRIKEWADIVLWGHDHQPKARTEKSAFWRCTILPGGAAFDRRVADHPRWTNAYGLITIDVPSRKGTAHIRRWSDTLGKWIAHEEVCPDGRFSFDLPRLTKVGPSRIRAAASTRMAAAEKKYRDLLLEACDIVDLANLPEQDRHIAARQLELRNLYVPLRVNTESVPADGDLTPALKQTDTGPGAPDREASNARVSLGERLALKRRLVVLGDPGGGKTTLTRWIAAAYLLRAKGELAWEHLPDAKTLPEVDWLPIMVRCRDLDAASRAGSLDDILKHTLRKAELTESEARGVHSFLRNCIDSTHALLILDGLDEIPSAAERARFCKQIESIAIAYPNLPVIATSRIVGYRELGRRLRRGFEHLTLAAFDSADKDQFSRRWCNLVERPERRDAAAAELVADIHASDRIERLTGNPMLLTTMALVKRKVGKLPQRRADLYWEAVQVLLNWRSEVDIPIDQQEALPQLEYLAFVMCDAGIQRLREDQVIAHFELMRTAYPNLHAVHSHTPLEFLRLLESRTALLVETGRLPYLGRSVAVWEFRHLTFQEYLAARALVDGCYPGYDPAFTLPAVVERLAKPAIIQSKDEKYEKRSGFDVKEQAPRFFKWVNWPARHRL